uniref:Rho-GAP domain-containing protein n=1 Tax=Trichuris muris TaxID=70415 RepID=A0A5S6Q6Q6_TRIMR
MFARVNLSFWSCRSKPKKTVFGKLKDKGKDRDKDVKAKVRSKSKSSKSKGDAEGSTPSASIAYTRNVFGVPISEALRNDPSYDRVPVPAFVRQCIDYILEYGLTQEGIYRLTPPKSVLEDLRASINAGDEPSFSDAHQAACLLKMFIRELPEPLFTWTLLSKFEESVTTCRSIAECLGRLSELIERLPKPNKYFLAYFFLHLQGIMQKSDENKMTLANLGVLLQPLFNVSPALLNVFMQNPRLLFPNVQLKK